MQENLIDRVVPRHMRRANDIVRRLMLYYGRAGRAGCRDAAAGVFGHNSWDDLQLACMHQYPSAPFDEECQDLVRRWRAQARILCSRLGGVDPDGLFESPMRPKGPPDPVDSIPRAEVRMEQAGKRYEQLLAQVLVAELQPTAYEPVRGTGAELLAGASSGTVAALPLYLVRWWNVNLKHQREVGQDLGNFPLDADSRAGLLKFGQYWGAL
jgi:hypothetical protein